jgi:hypothetical protein
VGVINNIRRGYHVGGSNVVDDYRYKLEYIDGDELAVFVI